MSARGRRPSVGGRVFPFLNRYTRHLLHSPLCLYGRPQVLHLLIV